MKAIIKELVSWELKSRDLIDVKRGLYLPEGHAELIWQGKKTLILKDRKFNLANERLLIFDKNYAYGYIWLGSPFIIRSRNEFEKLADAHRVTDEQFRRWHWKFPLYGYSIIKKRMFKKPLRMSVPRGVQNILLNPEKYLVRKKQSDEKMQCPNCDYIIEKKQVPVKLSNADYKRLLKSDEFDNQPLPRKYYFDQRAGNAWAQFHVRGVLPKDKKAFDAGDKTFQEIIVEHSLHCDLRWKLYGLPKIYQGILLENDMDSYIRCMLGKLNPHQAGPANVQKALFVSKEKMKRDEPETKVKERRGEYLIDKKGAKIVDEYIIHKRSFWIAPGDVGATMYAWAYLGTIWTGKIITGVEREDLHELFFYPDKDQPELNQKLFDGKFVIKAFRRPRGEPLYWIWKATANPQPINPYCHIDRGVHDILPEVSIKYFSKEEYPEWKTRKQYCK